MSGLRLALALLVWLALSSSPRSAHAEDVRPFRYAPKIELPLLGAGVLTWLVSEALKPALAPAECRVCGVRGLDAVVQQRVRWGEVEPAHRASDVLLMGIVPGAAYGSALALGLGHGTRRTAVVDVLTLSEAWVLTSNLTQLVKLLVGRERPYVHTQREEARDFVLGPDDHLSFFSGHTSSTFALAVASGAIASFRGYREAPVVWAVGMPLAALTGYFRLAADRHYLSDVLTGALVGSLVGVLVPWLHARGMESTAPEAEGRARPPPPPGTLSVSFVH